MTNGDTKYFLNICNTSNFEGFDLAFSISKVLCLLLLPGLSYTQQQ